MKTMNLIKIAGVVLMGIVCTLPVQAGNDKNSHTTRASINQLHRTIRLTPEDIRTIRALLDVANAVNLSWNSQEVRFALREGEENEYILRFEDAEEVPLEDWMLEPDYLDAESGAAIEPWMLQDDYLEEENQPLESWMFSHDRLSRPAPCDSLEGWMFDSNYLSR